MQDTHFRNDILCFPGYLSKNSNTTGLFYSEFDRLLRSGNSRNVFISFLRGMGSANNQSRITLQRLELARVNHVFKNGPQFQIGQLNENHSKMLFFYRHPDFSDDEASEKIIGKICVEAFLEKVTVDAVCIGSTNFSWASYFDSGSNSISKGEADVILMARDEANPGDFQNIVRSFESNSNADGRRNIEETARATLLREGSIEGANLKEEFPDSVFGRSSFTGNRSPHEYLKDMLTAVLTAWTS